MTVVDRVASPTEGSSITKLSLAGAICYALWGCLHLQCGIRGLPRGCCPRARNGAGPRLPRCLELAIFWRDGDFRRSNIEYPKQCVGLLNQSRHPHLGRYGSDFLHATPRIHAALARCCRSGPVGARLDLYHTRLFVTASTTATISAVKLGA
jgi:hypothetical protein